jgi:hypothetical protein
MNDLAGRAMGGGGGIGVQDEPPAPAVNAYIMVILAQKHTIPQGGLASMALVPQVVHVTPGRRALAAGPFAVPADAELNRAADRGRDVVGVANVEDDRLTDIRRFQ